MRFTTVPRYLAAGVCGTVLLVSALTLGIIGPAHAAEVPVSAPQAVPASYSLTRDSVAFDIAVYRPSQQQRGTVVLLHGFPGTRVGSRAPNTQSLVDSLTKAGYSVVRFNYIGSWANGGQFSWFGGVLDTEAVLRFLRTDEARELGVDGSRIVLVGHSYGGWVALMAAARDPTVRCVATMASHNLGRGGQLMRNDEIFYQRRLTLIEGPLQGPEPPIRAVSAKSLVDDAVSHAEAWDLTRHVEQLRSRQLLFVSAGQDSVLPQRLYLQPLLDGLLRASAPTVSTAAIEGADHNFSQHGPQVNSMIEAWITQECKL